MAGVASRRAAEELIRQGRVSVNGRTVLELGTKADPARDEIRVDGSRLKGPERLRYLLLNKPAGVVTTRSDPGRRPTVIQLLHGVREYVYPVGRLDYESEGLLLLTNDGDLAARLTHPRHGVEREYHAWVLGMPDDKDLDRLRRGDHDRRPTHRSRGGRDRPPGPREARRAGDALGGAARRAQPPGAEDVRGDRPPGRRADPHPDRTARRRPAQAGPVPRAHRRRGATAAEGRPRQSRRGRAPLEHGIVAMRDVHDPRIGPRRSGAVAPGLALRGRHRGRGRHRHRRAARDGPRADLQVRLRQAVARRRPELGELAAPHRLVHVLARHPRLRVLRAAVARRPALAGRRPAGHRDASSRPGGRSSRTRRSSSTAIARRRSRSTTTATASSTRRATSWR